MGTMDGMKRAYQNGATNGAVFFFGFGESKEISSKKNRRPSGGIFYIYNGNYTQLFASYAAAGDFFYKYFSSKIMFSVHFFAEF